MQGPGCTGYPQRRTKKKGFEIGGNIDEIRSVTQAQVRSIVSLECKRKSTDLGGCRSRPLFLTMLFIVVGSSGQAFGCISGDAALAVVCFPCQTMRRSAVEKRVLVFPG